MEDLNQDIRWGQSRPAPAKPLNNANKYNAKSKQFITMPPCNLPNSGYKPGALKRSASFTNLYIETPKPRNWRSRSVTRNSDNNKVIECNYNSDFEVNYDSDCSESQYLTSRQSRKSGRRRCNIPSPDKYTTDDELEKQVNTSRGRSRQRNAKFSGYGSDNEQTNRTSSQRYIKSTGQKGNHFEHDGMVSSTCEHLQVNSSPVVSKPGIKIKIKSGSRVSFVEPHSTNSPAVSYDSASDNFDSNYHLPRRRSRRKSGGQSDLEASDVESDFESGAEDLPRRKPRRRKVHSKIENSEPEDTAPQYLPVVTIDCEFCEDVFQCEEDLEDHCLKHFSTLKNLHAYLNSRRLSTKPDERVKSVLKEHHEIHHSKFKKKVNFANLNVACIVDLKSNTTGSESEKVPDFNVRCLDDLETPCFDKTVTPPESKTDLDIEVKGRKIYVSKDAKLAIECLEKTFRVVLSPLRTDLEESVSASMSPSRKKKTSGTHFPIKDLDSNTEADICNTGIVSDIKNNQLLPSSNRKPSKSRKLNIENREKDFKFSHVGISEQLRTDCVNSSSIGSRETNKTRKMSNKSKDQDQKSNRNTACIVQTADNDSPVAPTKGREKNRTGQLSEQDLKSSQNETDNAAVEDDCAITKSQLHLSREKSKARIGSPGNKKQNLKLNTQAACGIEIERDNNPICQLTPTKGSKRKHSSHSNQETDEKTTANKTGEIEVQSKKSISPCSSSKSRHKNKTVDHKHLSKSDKVEDRIDKSNVTELSPFKSRKSNKTNSDSESSEGDINLNENKTDFYGTTETRDKNNATVILSPKKQMKNKSREHSSEAQSQKTNEEIHEKISEINSDTNENDVILSPKKRTKNKSRDQSSKAKAQKTNEEIHEKISEINSDRNENDVTLSPKKRTKNKSRDQSSEAKAQKNEEIHEKISEINSDRNENDVILSPKKRTKNKSRDQSSDAKSQKTNKEIHEKISEINSDRNENDVILSPKKRTKNKSRDQSSEAKSQKTKEEIHEKISEINSDRNENDVILSPKKRTKNKSRDQSSDAKSQKTKEEIHEKISEINSDRNENDVILLPKKRTKNKSRDQSSEAQTQKIKEEIHKKRSVIDFHENANDVEHAIDVSFSQSGNQLYGTNHSDFGRKEQVLEPDEGDNITSESSKVERIIDNTNNALEPTSQKKRRKKIDSDLNKQQTAKNMSDPNSIEMGKISIDKTTTPVLSSGIKKSSKQLKPNQSSTIKSHNQSLIMDEMETECINKGLNTTEQTKSSLEKKMKTKREQNIAELKLRKDKLSKSVENLKFDGREHVTNDKLLSEEDINQKINTARSKSVESKKDKHSKTQTRSKSAETRNQPREDTCKVDNKQLKELKEDLMGWSKDFERMRMLTVDLCQSDLFSSLGPMENHIIPRWQTSRKGKREYVSSQKAKRKSDDRVSKKAQTSQEYETAESPFEFKVKIKKKVGRTTEPVSNKTLDGNENGPFDRREVAKTKLANSEYEKQTVQNLVPENTHSIAIMDPTKTANPKENLDENNAENLKSPRKFNCSEILQKSPSKTEDVRKKIPKQKDKSKKSHGRASRTLSNSKSKNQTENVKESKEVRNLISPRRSKRIPVSKELISSSYDSDSDIKTTDVSKKTLDKNCSERTDETDSCTVKGDTRTVVSKRRNDIKCAERTDKTDGCAVAGDNRTIDLSKRTLDTKCAEMADETDGCAIRSDRIQNHAGQNHTPNLLEENNALKGFSRKHDVQSKLIQISKSVLREDSPLKHYCEPAKTDKNTNLNSDINQGNIDPNTTINQGSIDQYTNINQENIDLDRIENKPEFAKDMTSKIEDKCVHAEELEEISDNVLVQFIEESGMHCCALDINDSVTPGEFCDESAEISSKKSGEHESENTHTDELFILSKHMADKNKSVEENLNTMLLYKCLELTGLTQKNLESRNTVTDLTVAEKEDERKKKGQEDLKQNNENNKTEKMNNDVNEEKSNTLSSKLIKDACGKYVKSEKRKIPSECENPSKVRKVESAGTSSLKKLLLGETHLEISKTKMSAARDEHVATNNGGNRWLRCRQCNKLCHTQRGLEKHQQEHGSCKAQNSNFLTKNKNDPSVNNSDSVVADIQVNTGKADSMNILFLSCKSLHDTGNSKQKYYPIMSQILSNSVRCPESNSPCKSGSSKSESENKSMETNVEITSMDIKMEDNLSNNSKSKTLRKQLHKSKEIDENSGKANEGVKSIDRMKSRDTGGLAEDFVNSETIDSSTEDIVNSETIDSPAQDIVKSQAIEKEPSSDAEPIKIKISLKHIKTDDNVKKKPKSKPKPAIERRKLKMVLSKVKLGNFKSEKYVCKFNGTPEKPNWTVNKNDTQQLENEASLSNQTTVERSVKDVKEKDLTNEQKNELKIDRVCVKSDKYNDKDGKTGLSLDNNCNYAQFSGKLPSDTEIDQAGYHGKLPSDIEIDKAKYNKKFLSNTEIDQTKELVKKQEKFHYNVKNTDSSKSDKKKISRAKNNKSENVKLKEKANKIPAENLTDFEKALVGKEERKKPEKSAAKKLKKEVMKNEALSLEYKDKQDQNDLPLRYRKSASHVLEEAHHFKRSKMAQNIFSKKQKRDLDDGLPDFTTASVTLNDLPPLFVSSKSPTKIVNSRNEKHLSSPKGISSKLNTMNDNAGVEIGKIKEMKKQLEAAGIGSRGNASLKLKDLMKLSTSGSVFSQTWNKQKGGANVLSSHSQPVLPSFSDVFLADGKVKETSFSGISRFANNHFDMSFSESLGADNVNETSFGSQSSSLFKFDSGLGNENTLNHTTSSALNHSATSALNHSASSAFQTVDEMDSIRKSVESGLNSIRRETEKGQFVPQISSPHKASPGCATRLNSVTTQNFSSTPSFKSAMLSQSSRGVRSDLNLSLISHASEIPEGEPKPKRPRIKRYIVSEVEEKQDNKYTKDFKSKDSTELPGTSSAGNSSFVQSQHSTNADNMVHREIVTVTSNTDLNSDKNNVRESRLRIISGDSDSRTVIGGRLSTKTVDDTTLLDYEFDEALDGLSDHDSYDQSLMEHSTANVKEDKHKHDAHKLVQDVPNNSNSNTDFYHGNITSKINAKPVKESRIIYEQDSEKVSTEDDCFDEEFENEFKQVEENSPALDKDLEEESRDLVIDIPNVKDLPKEFNFTVKVGVDQERVVNVENESQKSEIPEEINVWENKVQESDSDIEEIDLMASLPSSSSKTYINIEENNNLMPSGNGLAIKDTLECNDDAEYEVKQESDKDEVSNTRNNYEPAPEELGRSEVTSLSDQELMNTDSQWSYRSKCLENRKSAAGKVSPSNECEDVLEIFASDDEASFLDEDSEDLPSEPMGSSSRPPSAASSVAAEAMTVTKEPTASDVKIAPQMPQQPQQQQLHTQKPQQKLQPPIPSLFQRQLSGQSSSGSVFKGRWMPKTYCYNYLSWNSCKNGKACAYKHELPTDDVLEKYLPQLMEAIDNCSLKPGELERAMFMLESQEYFQKMIDNDRVEHLFSGSWYTNNMDYCMKLLQIIYQRGHVKPEQIDDMVILWKRSRGQYGIEPLVKTFYIARNLNIQPNEESIHTLLQVFVNSENLKVLWDLMVYCTEIEGFTVPMPCIERALMAAFVSPDRDVMNNALNWLKESDLSVLENINSQLLQQLRYKLLQMNETEMASSVDYLIRSSRASAQNAGHVRSETNTPVESSSRSRSSTPSLLATQNIAVATNLRNGMGEFDHILAEIESVKFSPNWAFLADLYIECSSIKCPIPLFILKRFLKMFTKEDGFQHVGKSWTNFCRHIASSHSQKQAENPALALDKVGLSHMATEIFYACHQKSMWNQGCEILQSIQRTSFLILSRHVAEQRGESMVPLAVDAFVQASIPEQAVAVISDYSKKPLNLNVKTRLLTFFNTITQHLCSKANFQATMDLLQIAFKWNFQDLDLMASTVIGECLQHQIIDLPLQVMNMYIARTRPFTINPVVKRCLLNASVLFGHMQYSMQLYEELKKCTTLFLPAKFPNSIVLQPIHTHFEARFVIEDHLNDLYNRLCEKAMAGNQLTRQDLHLKVLINSQSVLTNDKLPYIDLVPMTLLVAEQILTELNLSSEIKSLNKILLVQPQSLEQYLQNLDVSRRKQGLKFVNRIEPSAGKRR